MSGTHKGVGEDSMRAREYHALCGSYLWTVQRQALTYITDHFLLV